MSSSENPVSAGGRRVLVVEDQADTRKLIVATLGLRKDRKSTRLNSSH